MMARLKLLLLIAIALVAAAALGWWMGQPKPVQETAAPAQRQADGALVLERRPDAAAKPKQQIPPKAKVERLSRVKVQPAAIAEAGKPCPPVTVDMTLVREADGGRRVLASSPDGQVVGGLDVPIDTAAPPPDTKRWAAGVSWAPADSVAGVWIDRDVPVFNQVVRVGVELNQVRTGMSAAGVEGRVRIGFAF